MGKLAIFKSLLAGKGRVAVLAISAGFGLVIGVAGSAHATSGLDATLNETADFVTHKVATGEPNAEQTPAADPIKTCGPSPADKDSSAWGKYFRVNGVNIRRSPSTSARICAQGQKSHVVDYHCWAVGSDGHTWTYLRDATTHYAGWVRDNLLVGNGSLVHC